MTSSDSKVTKIQTHFKALSEASPSLNAASDELTKTVAILDESLKKLNVGLTAWVTFRSRDDDDAYHPERYDNDQIGYCKVNGTWGIALRRVWGDPSSDVYGGDGPWLFNDASREMRVYGVDKIPEVIEALAKEALSATKQIQEKTKQVLELASVVKEIADAPKDKKVIAPGYQSPRTMKDLAALAKGVQKGMKSMEDLADLAKGQQGSK
jgi:hypothetical protein